MAEEIILKPDDQEKQNEQNSENTPETNFQNENLHDDEEMFELGKEEEKPQLNQEEQSTFEEQKPDSWLQGKKFILLMSILGVILLLLLILVLFLFLGKNNKKPTPVQNFTPQTQTQQNDISAKFEMQKIQTMVQKANALYLKGEIEQALKAYEQIAIYSEAVSNYNLGVSQMKQKNYALALESFKKAIASKENQTVAAINAAVCALYLGNEKLFEYYIDLAYVYLSNEGNSKLFNYYLSLINYYKGYYLESLQMLEKTHLEPYNDSAKYLSAKIYTQINAENKAIANLQSQGNYESSLPLGLLYARIGEWDKAKIQLERAMKVDSLSQQALSALALVELKTGKYQNFSTKFNNKNKQEQAQILKLYKIKASLNKELFDISIAQDKFTKDFLNTPQIQAELLFYFAPYQVFNQSQAFDYINKANAAGFLEDEQSNNAYLNKGNALSSINAKLSQIINQAFEYKLRDANEGFKNLIKSYSEHSVLNYNLALSYAQLKNYDQAYKYFTTSYHLDPTNYVAGAFAILCAKLIHKDFSRLNNEILENINADTKFKAQISRNIIFLANNDYASMLPYLDEQNQHQSPINLIFRAIIAKNNNLQNQADAEISKLKQILPKDIMANILFFNAQNSNLNIKEYTKNAQRYFQNNELDYNALFGGASVVLENYVTLMQISGLLNQERNKLKQYLNLSKENSQGITLALAYMDIFAKQFKESYALYNILIDDFNIKDSYTLFLAAVAAIGANNPNSAVALLELAKLQDGQNQEARVALGLLYHELENYEPALYQYARVENNFKSNFFTFDLKNSNPEN